MMAPPMSQRLKQSAHKGAQDSAPQESQQLPLVTKPSTLKNLPLKRTRASAPAKNMELSVTISVGNDDISLELLQKVDEFLQKECISGLCSIERGGGMQRLHLQMVCRLLASSVVMVNKKLKQYLGWEDPKKAPTGHLILSKALRNSGLHTYTGMLGYCMKDKGEDHFQCIQKNVTDVELVEGEEEYIKYGTPFAKNRVILTHKNLIERAATYAKYKLRKHIGSILPGTLLPMLQSGQYLPSASWVLPVRQGGMEYNRAAALWKCMMNLETIEMQDVTQIFFEHSNPGSRLAELGRQRLATHLEEAREGATHEYNVTDDVRIPQVHEPNSLIVLHESEEDPLPDQDLDDPRVTKCPAMYIPVLYRDRDVANNLTV